MKKHEEKKWGLYNTFNNPEVFNQLDEIDTWKLIDNISEYIFWIGNDPNMRWKENESSRDLIDSQYNLEYLVYSTRRFGVEFSSEPSTSEHVERSESYNAWFKFWSNHFESMPHKMYNEFINDKFSGKDISKYMPNGSWKDLLNKPLQKKLEK